MAENESFLARWSRRKRAAKQDTAQEEQGASAVPAAPLPATPPAPVPELPAVEALDGLRSDYRGFLDPKVDESLRRTALKKLFGDPHFNTMDGLDTYIDDYSRPDPIPEAMLRELRQANALSLFADEDKAAAGAAEQAAPPAEISPSEMPPSAAAQAPLADAVPGGADPAGESAARRSSKIA